MDWIIYIAIAGLVSAWVYLCWKGIIPDPWAKWTLLVAGGLIAAVVFFVKGKAEKSSVAVPEIPTKAETSDVEDVVRDPVSDREVESVDDEVKRLESEEADVRISVPETEDQIVEDLGSFVSDLEGDE